MFTFFAFIAHSLRLTVLPLKKIISVGTDIATTPRCFFTSLLREGNVDTLFFHQSSGS